MPRASEPATGAFVPSPRSSFPLVGQRPATRDSLVDVVRAGNAQGLRSLLRQGVDAFAAGPADPARGRTSDRLLDAAQTFQRLWPPETRQHVASDPAWLVHLKNYAFDAALEALLKEIPADRPAQAWLQAVREESPELAKAVLVLGDHRLVEMLRKRPMPPPGDTPHYGPAMNSVLHAGLMLQDAALSDHLKRYPYYSLKGDRALAGHFNGLATLPSTGDVIECRHLALEWIEQLRTSPSGKPDYRRLDSVDAVSAHVSPSREAEFDALLAHADEVHLVEIDRWGEFASRQFRQLEIEGVAAKRMIIGSGAHAMAVEFKRKLNEGKTRFVQNVYDPNMTNVHRRSKVDEWSPQLERTSLRAHIGDAPQIQRSALADDSAVIVIGVPEAGVASLPDARQPRPAGRSLQSAPTSLSPSSMHWLLAGDFAGDLAAVKPRLVQLARQHPEAAFELLTAENAKGRPGLFIALQNGSAHSVAEFSKIVEHGSFTPEQQVKLLSAKSRENQLPGFAMALTAGQPASVMTFVAAVGRSQIKIEDKVQLLAAADWDLHVPGLFLATFNSHADTVRAFIDSVARLPLGPGHWTELLQSRHPGGIPALSYAMTQGDADVTAAFTSAVLDSALPRDVVLAVLRSRDGDGQRAYESVEQTGGNAASAVFRSLVQASALAPEDKARLLRTKVP